MDKSRAHGIRAVKQLVPWPRKELHGHRMDFARLHSRAYLIAKLHLVSDAVIGECVTRLVGKHIDIARSAVEIREDERRLVFEYLRAVAARSLALCAQDIHEGVVIHKVYELPCLGAHLLIHFLSRGEDILGRAVGLRVALFKRERVVVYFMSSMPMRFSASS